VRTLVSVRSKSLATWPMVRSPRHSFDELSFEVRSERATGRGFFLSMVSFLDILSGGCAADGGCPSERWMPKTYLKDGNRLGEPFEIEVSL
jgi:hypothetical protein